MLQIQMNYTDKDLAYLNLLSEWAVGVRNENRIRLIIYLIVAASNKCPKEKRIKVQSKSNGRTWEGLLFRYRGQKKKPV